MNVIVKKYQDLGYYVIFNKETGLFARIENDGYAEPFWSENGPELLDIAITNYCEINCSFCYRQSNAKGKHMLLSDFKKIIKQASKIGVLQIALGGGNPNQHPEFIKFLKITKNSGIVPSYTTNGYGLTDDILRESKINCGAIAISAYKPYRMLAETIERVTDYNIKTNIHFLVNKNSISTAIAWLKSPPMFLNKINAVVFLNYKPVNTKTNISLPKSNLLPTFFDLIKKNRYSFKIGFDSCFMSGIVSYLIPRSVFMESCDSARYSAFISEDLKMYPCSFMINKDNPGDLNKESIESVWKSNYLFKNHRERILNNRCIGCQHKNECKGGCTFLPSINLCKTKNE